MRRDKAALSSGCKRNLSPWWIADFIPNVQAELGIALMLVGMIPMCWRHR